MTVCKSCTYTIQCWLVLWWQCHLRHYWDISFEPKLYLLHLCYSFQHTANPKIFTKLRGKHVVWQGLTVDFRLKLYKQNTFSFRQISDFQFRLFWDLFQLSQMTGRRWWSVTGPFDLQPRRSPFVATREFMGLLKRLGNLPKQEWMSFLNDLFS